MSISVKNFGIMPSGEEVYLYTVDSGGGLRAEFLSLGCIIRRLEVTDSHGNTIDTVLGRETLEDYAQGSGCFGATVGRYANRIRGGKFEVNGTTYFAEPNQNGNLLHSGWANFAGRLWRASYEDENSNSISFEIDSPDGENSFPGDLNAVVTFTLEGRDLIIHYEAVANKDTVMGFTNHSYFNLNGHASGDVLDHTLSVEADFYTPVDDTNIPTGEVLSVRNTPYDFREPVRIGANMELLSKTSPGKGYDMNLVLNGRGMRRVACLRGDKSGITMTTHTDKPGLQMYIAKFKRGEKPFKDGVFYEGCQSVCLETQFFPDSTEYGHFPSPIVKCGDKYDYTTIYSFDVE